MKSKISAVVGILIFMCLLCSFFITLSSNSTIRAILNLDEDSTEYEYEDDYISDYEYESDSDLQYIQSNDGNSDSTIG